MSINFFVGILLILSDLIQLTRMCSSRNTGRARPPSLARPNIANRTYPCPEDAGETYCRNGGTCFTLFENSTDYSCRCKDGYCGVTCGDKYTRYGCYSSSSSALTMDEDFGGPAETYPCPPGPAEWLCLNGGTCFTVFENGSDYSCFCPEGYCGLRCGEKYTRYGCFSTYLVISASVASAGCIAVCLVVFAIALYIFYEKKFVTVNDDELKLYLQQNVELRTFTRTLSLTKFDDFENTYIDNSDNPRSPSELNKSAVQHKMQRDLPSISYI